METDQGLVDDHPEDAESEPLPDEEPAGDEEDAGEPVKNDPVETEGEE